MNTNNYIVINDGQFQYPVPRASLREEDTEARLRKMSGDEYSAWCLDVPMDRSHGAAGSQGCIDFCTELIEAGADVWYLNDHGN
jgi:hypothetical protein